MNLGTLINPSKAIAKIRLQIEKQLNKKIGAFNIVYITAKNDLTFFIDGLPYGFADSLITSMITAYTKRYLKKDQILDMVILVISIDNTINAKICYTENNKKLFISKII
jgi:hypothetical protein